MIGLEEVLLTAETPIVKAMEQMVQNSRQIVLVIDERRRLLGTVTDGDVRRGLLRHVRTEQPVAEIMNRNPAIVSPDTPREACLRIMRERAFLHLPVVDEDGVVVGLEVLAELMRQDRFDHPVVILAGGKGSRLMPLTEDTPKPLLSVGGRPLLETIVEGFAQQGFHRFYLSVNYKSEMIEAHFGDGGRLGVKIDYLREEQPLGTAGPLSQLPEPPKEPIIVMNGDLLTAVDFKQFVHFHREQQAVATMGVREYDFQVPFGVAETDGTRLLGISEKPVQRFFVNAGIYLLDPTVVTMVPKGRPMDMPELFQKVLDADMPATVFPIREYWMDVGRLSDFEKAQRDFPQVFG